VFAEITSGGLWPIGAGLGPRVGSSQVRSRRREQGAVLLVLILAGLLAAGLLLHISLANQRTGTIQRGASDQQVLLRAKQALIDYAVTHDMRGHLPCPADPTLAGLATEGQALAPNLCDQAQPRQRLGVLPWRTLGLADTADSRGERLWYAVSRDVINRANNAFRINPAQALNNLLTLNGQPYVALVFIAGEVKAGQNRSPGTAACAYSSDARPRTYCANNYMDRADDGSSNANLDLDFFIDHAGINEQAIGITAKEFFDAVEARVLNQVASCLSQYVQDPNNVNGYLPWAVPADGSATTAPGYPNTTTEYSDVPGVRIGRVPRVINTVYPGYASAVGWSGSKCPLRCNNDAPPCAQSWMRDWQELLFMAVSERDAADSGGNTGLPRMTVTLRDGRVITNAKAVVMLGGAALATQSRASNVQRNTLQNYLEGENANGPANLGDGVHAEITATATFNDRVVAVR
jgi:hypothetical protein